jgi:hypothetical protein
MARAGPCGTRVWTCPLRQLQEMASCSVSTARAECLSSGSVAVTAVTSYPSGTPSFFGHRVIDLFCHETAVIQGRNFVVVGFSRHRGGQIMKTLMRVQLVTRAKKARNTQDWFGRTKVVVAAARDRAIEMAQQRVMPSMPRAPTVLQRRRLAERLSARS